jgi:hypothetical protein
MAWSLSDYEKYVYSVQSLSPRIRSSNLVFIHRGKFLAEVTGQVLFESEISLEVREILYFLSSDFIRRYGYLIKRGDEVLYWYDSQPHPDDPALQSTHPHHKHFPPDIKHHRIPAPGLCFDKPNLEFLIREIEAELL